MTQPDDKNQLVPAFESSLGLGDQDAPVMVDKKALEHFNQELQKSGRATLANHVEAANIAALFTKRAIRPDEIAGLRREMFRVVSKGLREVEDVLDGKKAWSASQVRLFSVLTERVMPKLSTISVEGQGEKKVEDMSVEELEAIVMGKKKSEAIDVVVKEGDRLEKVADRTERRNANMEIKKGLAHIVGLDEAEKKYIARRATRYSLRDEEGRTLRVLAKPQPAPNPEQLERLRKARAGGPRARWAAMGLSPEEIDRRDAERLEKLRQTWAHVMAKRTVRNALTLNLGDAHQVPQDIQDGKQKVLREFKVPNRKGVRSQTAIVKDQQKRQAKEAREKERRENPRIYVNGIGGMEDVPKPRLRDLRAKRPDLFEDDKK